MFPQDLGHGLCIAKCSGFVVYHVLFAAIKHLSIFILHRCDVPLTEVCVGAGWFPEEYGLSVAWESATLALVLRFPLLILGCTWLWADLITDL